MRLTILIGLIGALAGAISPGVSAAANYRFVDEEGVVHYTNAPPDAAYQRFVTRSSAPTASRQTVPGGYSAEIQEAAHRHGVDARLVNAVIAVESAGNPRAVSSKGAQGLMQLMPATADVLGVRDPFNPRDNIDGGVRHLRGLLDSFGDLSLALAAYNAGAEPVRSYRGIPPYPETQEYVRKILGLYSGDLPTSRVAPQRIYRLQDKDGTVTYTNLPPRVRSGR